MLEECTLQNMFGKGLEISVHSQIGLKMLSQLDAIIQITIFLYIFSFIHFPPLFALAQINSYCIFLDSCFLNIREVHTHQKHFASLQNSLGFPLTYAVQYDLNVKLAGSGVRPFLAGHQLL